MEKDNDLLVYEYISQYMHIMRRPRSGKLGELEESSRNANYPISDPETSDLIEIICRIKKPKKILEIGTCVGFSALLMSNSSPESEITTIERNSVMIQPAKKNFNDFGAKNIKLIEDDALKVLPKIEDMFDLIFIDAAKGQYPSFLKECLRIAAPGCIIIADNVLFNGLVAKGKPDIHRNKTIVVRLNKFLQDLESNTGIKTVLLPISDGVTLSYVLREDENEKNLSKL